MKKEVKKHLRRRLDNLQRKQPNVEKVDFTYDKCSKGTYYTKLTAKTKRDQIHLKDENENLQESITRLFNSLTRVLQRKKHRKPFKVQFDLRDTA